MSNFSNFSYCVLSSFEFNKSSIFSILKVISYGIVNISFLLSMSSRATNFLTPLTEEIPINDDISISFFIPQSIKFESLFSSLVSLHIIKLIIKINDNKYIFIFLYLRNKNKNII